jgi:hypothetical protein
VQPSKRTGVIHPYYYPTPKAMKAVKEKIREVVRGGQHWDLPVFIRERINPIPRGWGNYFKTGELAAPLPANRQIHELGALYHAAEEIPEAVEGVEGPPAVLVLQLPRPIQALRLGGYCPKCSLRTAPLGGCG